MFKLCVLSRFDGGSLCHENRVWCSDVSPSTHSGCTAMMLSCGMMWRNVSVGLGVLVYRGCTLECWVLPDDLQWEYISVSNSLLINMTIIVFYCFNFISQNDHSVLF